MRGWFEGGGEGILVRGIQLGVLRCGYMCVLMYRRFCSGMFGWIGISFGSMFGRREKGRRRGVVVASLRVSWRVVRNLRPDMCVLLRMMCGWIPLRSRPQLCLCIIYATFQDCLHIIGDPSDNLLCSSPTSSSSFSIFPISTLSLESCIYIIHFTISQATL